MKNKTLRLLAIMGALFGTRSVANAAESEKEDALHVKAEFSLAANEEFGFNADSFADISLGSHLRLQKQGYAIDYEGLFWKKYNFNGAKEDWLTLKHKINLENEKYALTFGRDLTAGRMTGYKNVAATTGFANDVKGHGANRSLTGINLWNKEYGWQAGWMAKDGEFGFNHLDMGVVGYQKQLNNQWGVQFQLGGGKTIVDYGAATIAYTHDKNNIIIADAVYKNDRMSGILMGQHKLRDRLALFANAEVTRVKGGKTEAFLEAGVSYDMGRGLKIVGAVQQGIGHSHGTSGVIGLQYSGSADFEK